MSPTKFVHALGVVDPRALAKTAQTAGPRQFRQSADLWKLSLSLAGGRGQDICSALECNGKIRRGVDLRRFLNQPRHNGLTAAKPRVHRLATETIQ